MRPVGWGMIIRPPLKQQRFEADEDVRRAPRRMTPAPAGMTGQLALFGWGV